MAGARNRAESRDAAKKTTPTRAQTSLQVAYTDSELVIGLVAPVGADLDEFQAALEVALAQFNYSCNSVRMSALAKELVPRRTPHTSGSTEFRRLNDLMDLGNAARKWGGGDALALAAAAAINAERPITNRTKGPRARTAHVIRSLKHPGEVQMLRRIYGPGFFLVGVIASTTQRREFLRSRKGCTEGEINDLFRRDEREADDLGQRTRDTFHLADAFLPAQDGPTLKRFVDLIFGTPCETPTADEYAMYLAFSAALRSADLSRQVGAVVVSDVGDLIAVGTNDVPRAGGGLFWPGTDDCRDWKLGRDTNEGEREKIVAEILALLQPTTVSTAYAFTPRRRISRDGSLVGDRNRSMFS